MERNLSYLCRFARYLAFLQEELPQIFFFDLCGGSHSKFVHSYLCFNKDTEREIVDNHSERRDVHIRVLQLAISFT